jgi:hypothetical protein
MNDPFIPMNAYIFIGVASLVLAFVTVMDNPDVENTNEEKSLTEYLPSFNGTTENANPETVNEVPEQPNSNNNPTGEVSTGNDMFNTNLNSDQGLAQNEVPLIQQAPLPAPQPKQAPAQNYGNPFNGGKNKTNKNGYGKKENKQNKHNKKTKRNKITK